MIYKATLDKASKVVTIIISLFFIGLTFIPLLIGNQPSGIGSFLLGFLFLSILLITFYFSIKSYQITENDLIINRQFDQVILNKSIIKNVFEVQKINIFLSIRTFGSGGLFGYFGEFWIKKFGNMTWYATRTDKVIVIETISNKKILITPDDYKKFFDKLNIITGLDKKV